MASQAQKMPSLLQASSQLHRETVAGSHPKNPDCMSCLSVSAQAKEQMTAFADTYFGQFKKTPLGMMRSDPQDMGPGYRNVVGLPGGTSSPLYKILQVGSATGHSVQRREPIVTIPAARMLTKTSAVHVVNVCCSPSSGDRTVYTLRLDQAMTVRGC